MNRGKVFGVSLNQRNVVVDFSVHILPNIDTSTSPIMSLRTSFRGLTSSLRSLSTTCRLSNAASTSTSQQTSPQGGSNTFADLSAIMSDIPNTSQVMDHLNQSTKAASGSEAPALIDPSAKRGYTAHGIPPDVDPLLDLVTNLLMKHGRKAEAQSRVSRLLSLM